MAKFYQQLCFILSVLRGSKFSISKLIEVVILWVYYTIPLGFSLILVLLGPRFLTYESTPFLAEDY